MQNDLFWAQICISGGRSDQAAADDVCIGTQWSRSACVWLRSHLALPLFFDFLLQPWLLCLYNRPVGLNRSTHPKIN